MSNYEYIDSQKAEPANLDSVVRMCRWLAVSTSGFYHWATRPQSATAARRQGLTARIQYFFEESEGTYGYRRIHADLAAEQTECSPELVRQIMRHQHLMACQPRPFRITTATDAQEAAGMPDLVNRHSDGPADDLLGVAVDDGGEVDESLPGVDVGDVADELHPGAVGGEVPVDEVGHVRRGQGVGLGGDAERAWLAGHQALVAHDLAHQLG